MNNTKYKAHLRGCYKNGCILKYLLIFEYIFIWILAGFGEVCNVKSECITPGSICGHTNCGKDLDKRCVCEGDTEFFYHSCEPIRGGQYIIVFIIFIHKNISF